MAIYAHITVSGGTGLQPLPGQGRCVEKARKTSDLGEEAMQQRERQADRNPRFVAQSNLSQTETRERESRWHGTGVSPTFAAQLLGQVMHVSGPAMRSVLAAYEGSAGPKPAPAFDRRF
jgi:hypothetical protein